MNIVTGNKITEAKLRDALQSKLMHLEGWIPEKEIAVPYIFIQNQSNLELWFFKQDICYFTPEDAETFVAKRYQAYQTGSIKSFEESEMEVEPGVESDNLITQSKQIRFECKNVKNKNLINSPHLILETKNGQPNTHEILAYIQKAYLIKQIFPDCKYGFAIFINEKQTVADRTYRLKEQIHKGAGFDEIFPIQYQILPTGQIHFPDLDSVNTWIHQIHAEYIFNACANK